MAGVPAGVFSGYSVYMIWILIVLIVVAAAPFIIGLLLSAPRYRGPVSDHFNGKQFINPTGVKAKGLSEVLKWVRERTPGKWVEQRNVPPGPKPLPRYDNGVRITHVNHTTFLIQVDGVNILTDPVWSERVSPFSFVGPKRMRPPGLRLEDLPKIDLVLLSHNHYDHLDIEIVKKIHAHHKPTFIVPLGVGAYLENHGISTIDELDWWTSVSFSNVFNVEAVPAQHFSGRGLLDRDATLWCGFVIHRAHGNIYFAGDTGYNDVTFKEIGKRARPQLSIIPIGAFKPTWFMSPIHCSPEQAVQIHIDLQSGQSIASHFGTFPLADDGQQEPIQLLQESLKLRNIDLSKFIVLQEGIAQDFA